MPTKTDPALEFAEMCEKLAGSNSDKRGDEFLAKQFGVAPWSSELFQVIACIMQRGEALIEVIGKVISNEERKNEGKQHVRALLQAFSRDSILNSWGHQAIRHLTREHTQALKMLSVSIEQKVSYPKLSDDEVKDLLIAIDELRAWLLEQQLSDQDFIRQAMIEGLDGLQFRLQRLSWLGWGYCLDSLREVISAYLILEGARLDPNERPDAASILKKVGSFIKKFSDKVELTNNVIDNILKLYGALSLAYQGAAVAGLLK